MANAVPTNGEILREFLKLNLDFVITSNRANLVINVNFFKMKLELDQGKLRNELDSINFIL